MKENLKELREDILNEESRIQETVERLVKVRSQFTISPQNILIEPAMGTYLMNFYNGVEHILKRICKAFYKTFPQGESWHKELLDLSYRPPENKPPIFSKELVARLYPYKNFRHRFISGYGLQLRAEKMFELIDNVEPLWKDIQTAIAHFLKNAE